MIIDAVANLKHYTKLFPNIPDALEAMNRIEQQEFRQKSISSEVVSSSFKKERPNPLKRHNSKAHRNFVDLQIVLGRGRIYRLEQN